MVISASPTRFRAIVRTGGGCTQIEAFIASPVHYPETAYSILRFASIATVGQAFRPARARSAGLKPCPT
jgi:hypothetical protein